MIEVERTPLPLDKYEQYEIPQEYMAYIVCFKNITQLECDDIEYKYHTTGYKIFHTELQRATGDQFDYKLIIAKSGMIFQK